MMFVRMRFELQWRYAWVGLHWDVRQCVEQLVIVERRLQSGMVIERFAYPNHLHIYLCLIPFAALHLELSLGLPPEEASRG
jgi:hypothetical protein